MADKLYVSDYSHLSPCKFQYLNNLKMGCKRLSPKFCGWKKSIQWNVATLGKVKVYVVYDNEKIVHCSYAVWVKNKFRFLGKADIEIGPCWTHADYRGLGIYPAVLTEIIREELADGGFAYMVISDSNEASKRGVAKVGFRNTGMSVKRDFFKRFQVKNSL